MKLKSLLNEIENYLVQPSHIPVEDRFFVDKEYALAYLDAVKMDMEGVRSRIITARKTTEQLNIIDSLFERGLLVKDSKGYQTITPLGKKWLEQWEESKKGVLPLSPVVFTGPTSATGIGIGPA